MGWSFPGISYPVECVYSQSLGDRPDIAMLRCNPQAGLFPRSGTLTLTWSADTVTLPDCQVDLGRISYSPDGFYALVPALDRRWRWDYVAPVSGNYNVYRAGQYIAAYKKNIRQLAVILLTAMGEAGATVTALPTDIYPEVSWQCVKPAAALREMLEYYGFSIALGFGAEPVTIVQLGVGTTLPTTNVTSPTFTFDPKVRPRWVRVCYGESRAQVRFRLKPVVRETDGTWVEPALASYLPALGWEREDPETLPNVALAENIETYNNAVATVYRAYRVEKFADDTLTVPIAGVGVLASIQQILPIENRLISAEGIRTDGSGSPIRLWAKHDRRVREKGQPEEAREQVGIDFEITRYPYHFDGETGIVLFHEPLYYTSGSDHQFAEVYMEATVNAWDATTNAALHYEKDISFDVAGTGYFTHRVPEKHAESVVGYTSTHTTTGVVTTNQTALDTEAAAIAASLVASMTDEAAQDIIYSIPKLLIRCDGAIRQVQHILTEGERQHAVNRTRASRNTESDRGVPTRLERIAHAVATDHSVADRWVAAKAQKKKRVDD